jgi:hypothetical protein
MAQRAALQRATGGVNNPRECERIKRVRQSTPQRNIGRTKGAGCSVAEIGRFNHPGFTRYRYLAEPIEVADKKPYSKSSKSELLRILVIA